MCQQHGRWVRLWSYVCKCLWVLCVCVCLCSLAIVSPTACCVLEKKHRNPIYAHTACFLGIKTNTHPNCLNTKSRTPSVSKDEQTLYRGWVCVYGAWQRSLHCSSMNQQRHSLKESQENTDTDWRDTEKRIEEQTLLGITLILGFPYTQQRHVLGCQRIVLGCLNNLWRGWKGWRRDAIILCTLFKHYLPLINHTLCVHQLKLILFTINPPRCRRFIHHSKTHFGIYIYDSRQIKCLTVVRSVRKQQKQNVWLSSYLWKEQKQNVFFSFSLNRTATKCLFSLYISTEHTQAVCLSHCFWTQHTQNISVSQCRCTSGMEQTHDVFSHYLSAKQKQNVNPSCCISKEQKQNACFSGYLLGNRNNKYTFTQSQDTHLKQNV